MNKLSISISSEISNIVKVENFVETFTDYFALPSVLYGKISLSVIEAVNNAILSGNKRQPDKMVSLVAEKTDKQFKVTVSDEGITGRGLYLMKTLSDELIFENGGSTVTLVFNL